VSESCRTATDRTTAVLSDAHRRMLHEESGISPEVAAARGYRTIRRRCEVPEEFADWQSRRDLLVATYSPDGRTIGWRRSRRGCAGLR
jgi:hypothetical protein